MTEETTVSNQPTETADVTSSPKDMSGADVIDANIKAEIAEKTDTTAVSPEDIVTETLEGVDKSELITTETFEIPKEFYNEEGTLDEQAFLKDYHNKVKLAGKKGLEVPESVEAYSLEDSEVFEGILKEVDQEAMTRTKEWALEHKLSPEQYKAAMEYWYEDTAKINALAAQQPKICHETLKEAWGDDLDDNLALAGVAMREFGEGVDRAGIVDNPSVIMLLANIGKELQEDSPSARPKVEGLLSEEELNAIIADPNYYQDKEKIKLVKEHYAYKEKKGLLKPKQLGM
jgi:hypothetical protein